MSNIAVGVGRVAGAPDAGDVAVMPLPGGGFGVCQVAAVSASEFVVYALAWWSPEPPTLEQLRGLGPLLLTHHHNGGGLAHININREYPVPPDLDWLGRLPVPAELSVSPQSYSGWAFLPGAVARQRRWDTLVPEPAQSAYRSGRSDVSGDFGAGLVQVSTNASRLDLTGDVVPGAGPVRWSALDAFPRCTSLTWSGDDRGLADALASRPVVDTLLWSAAPSVADLSGTALSDLRLSGPAIDCVKLPCTLQQLTLDAAGMPQTVVAPDCARFRLTIDNAGPGLSLPHGLNRITTLDLVCDRTVSVAGLRRLPELRSLRVRWQNPPGELADADTLTDLEQLAILELFKAYGLRPDTLPHLPNLRHLHVDGLRKATATALQGQHRRSGVRLVLRGAKTDTWLAANLDNPFRDWAEDNISAATAACKVYADALRAIDAATAPQPLQILRTMVQHFNALGAKYSIIDTIRREEIADAYAALAERAGISVDEAMEQFDEERDF